ncbi:MAG: CPBP family intramembrane metalloprotease [Actinobacteria bacterium]|nr:CPBP family intramembrane metalloprotease [Actinomycetota bacterium]
MLPPPLPPPTPPPAPGAVRVRWGLGDFFFVFLAQVGSGLVAALIQVILGDGLSDSDALFFLYVPAQVLAMGGTILLIARKGRRSLAADFGLRLKRRDWTAFLGGAGLQFLSVAVAVPFALLIDIDEPAQDVVREIQDTRSVAVWIVIVLSVGILVPALEEVWFRGIMLRSLLRRRGPTFAVLVSGTTFGLIHVFNTGFTLIALPTIVTLCGLGYVLGLQALRHGSLSRPVLTHMGFNLCSLALVLAA